MAYSIWALIERGMAVARDLSDVYWIGGRLLWNSNGAAEGTMLAQDNPFSIPGFRSPGRLTDVDGALFSVTSGWKLPRL